MDKALNALQVENSELLGRIEELARAEEGARDVIEKLGAEVQAKSEAADALQGRLIAEQAAMVEVKVLAEDKAQRLARLESEMDALREVAGIAADGGKEGDMVSALLARVSALDAAAMEAHKERRALHNALVDLRGNIRVFCRVWP